MPPHTKDERVEIRVKTEDLKRWKVAADVEGLTLSNWLRDLGNLATAPLAAPFNEAESALQAYVRAGLRIGRYPTEHEVKEQMRKNDEKRVSRRTTKKGGK